MTFQEEGICHYGALAELSVNCEYLSVKKLDIGKYFLNAITFPPNEEKISFSSFMSSCPCRKRFRNFMRQSLELLKIFSRYILPEKASRLLTKTMAFLD